MQLLSSLFSHVSCLLEVEPWRFAGALRCSSELR